jgi:hypothetical protein
MPLDDKVLEAEEVYEKAGREGFVESDPANTPPCRANKVPGRGNWEYYRPPVWGVAR